MQDKDLFVQQKKHACVIKKRDNIKNSKPQKITTLSWSRYYLFPHDHTTRLILCVHITRTLDLHAMIQTVEHQGNRKIIVLSLFQASKTYPPFQVTQVTYCYGLASVVVRHPSSVNIFFSRTTEPILTKFGMQHLLGKETRNCKFHDPPPQGEVILG